MCSVILIKLVMQRSVKTCYRTNMTVRYFVIVLFSYSISYTGIKGAIQYQVFNRPVTWNTANDICDLAAPPYQGSTVIIDSSVMAEDDELWVKQTWSRSLRGCEDKWYDFETNCYKMFLHDEIAFTVAQRKCAENKAKLTNMANAAEQKFLAVLIPNFINGSSKWASVWSAGTDLVEESVWIWEGYNAKISPDIEWMPGQPDNDTIYNNFENCAGISVNPEFYGKLNDIICSSDLGVKGYVCKKNALKTQIGHGFIFKNDSGIYLDYDWNFTQRGYLCNIGQTTTCTTIPDSHNFTYGIFSGIGIMIPVIIIGLMLMHFYFYRKRRDSARTASVSNVNTDGQNGNQTMYTELLPHQQRQVGNTYESVQQDGNRQEKRSPQNNYTPLERVVGQAGKHTYDELSSRKGLEQDDLYTECD